MIELDDVPRGWGYRDCIARAIYFAGEDQRTLTPEEAADMVLAELAKQGYTFESPTVDFPPTEEEYERGGNGDPYETDGAEGYDPDAEPEKVVDLMAALQASVAAAKEARLRRRKG